MAKNTLNANVLFRIPPLNWAIKPNESVPAKVETLSITS